MIKLDPLFERRARDFCETYGHKYVDPELVDLAEWRRRWRDILAAQEKLGVWIVGAARAYLEDQPGTVAHLPRLEPRSKLRAVKARDCLPHCDVHLVQYVQDRYAPKRKGKKWSVSVFFKFRLRKSVVDDWKDPVFDVGMVGICGRDAVRTTRLMYDALRVPPALLAIPEEKALKLPEPRRGILEELEHMTTDRSNMTTDCGQKEEPHGDE